MKSENRLRRYVVPILIIAKTLPSVGASVAARSDQNAEEGSFDPNCSRFPWEN
jgi:hypothetical protein